MKKVKRKSLFQIAEEILAMLVPLTDDERSRVLIAVRYTVEVDAKSRSQKTNLR